MSFSIKGFVNIDELVNNQKDVVAGLGEISDINLTQSKQKQYFGNVAQPGYDLIIMHSKLNGVHQTCPDVVANAILAMAAKLKDFDYSDNFLLQYKAEFPDHNDPRVGPIATYAGVTLPTWVSFKLQLTSEVAEVKIWFSNDRFGPEFGEHEIVVVPPIDPVVGLYSDHISVGDLLAQEDHYDLVKRISEARGNYPETSMKPIKLRWIQPTEPSLTHTTVWTILCYGREAERYDNILEAIRQYLLANSEYSLSDWRNYLPEIQFAKIYHFIPFWHKEAISAGPTSQSLYRPSIKAEELVEVTLPFMPTSTETEIREFGEFFPILYKALGMVCVGASGNDEGEKMFTERYEDYTLIPHNDQNINRMSSSTRSAVAQVERLARLCEIDDGFMELPSDISRTIVSGITYLELTEWGIIFRMVTKQTSDNVMA